MQQFLDSLNQNFKHEATSGQQQLIEKLAQFVYDTRQDLLFVIKGYAGTGKTTLVSSLIKSLSIANYKSVLLAPTGRASKVLSLYSGKTAFTIHKKIYKAATNKEGNGLFMLQPNTNSNTIFIVDEASMIGDGSGTNEAKLQGTRSLLEDLMMYVYNGENCKLILLGDTAQLPPVGMIVSPALDIEYLKNNFHCEIYTHELTEVVRQTEHSGILTNATSIRNMLREDNTEVPKFNLKNFNDIIRLSGMELVEAIEDSYKKFGDDNTIIICRSNKRANVYNQEIRNRIKFHEDSISTGDYLMIVKNNYFWLEDKSKTDFIANGDIAEIVRIKKRNIEMFGFTFADVTLRLLDYPDMHEFDAKILLDTINAEAPALSYNQNKKLFDEVMNYYSDIPNRSARILKVKQDPFFNALQVKFAYAITCHKAQGGQWPVVFIEQGYLTDDMVNTEFKRWLYTAITRAVDKVYLINFNKNFFEENLDESI